MNDSDFGELHLTCLCGEIHNEENTHCGSCNNCLNDEMDAAWENDSMDGDHDSAMTSAGWGIDEDYCPDTPMFEDYYGGE